MRKWLAAAYVVYVLLLAYVLVTPGPVGPSETVRALDAVLAVVGIELGGRWTEFVMNVVLFVPAGLLGIFLVRGSRPGDWMMAGFVAATLVEVVQRYALPTRSGEARDVVANTFGALLGGLVAWVLSAWLHRRGEAD